VYLGTIILIAFLIALPCRPLLRRLLSKDEQFLPRRAFWVDFILCVTAGVLIDAYTIIVLDLPLFSQAAMLTGCIIAGFFIGLDSALSEQRQRIIAAKSQQHSSSPPGRLSPITKNFALVAITVTFFVALVLTLVFVRDVEWLTTIDRDSSSIHQAQLSVTFEILFIMGVLLVLITNLIFAYSKNLKLLFDNETQVLEEVRGGDLSVKVPVATNDEFGVIAGHTNHMIDGLRHRFELLSSLKLAEEVQQNLLPGGNPEIDALDISAVSLYCDQTGGDYYDFLPLPKGRWGVVVADVCGHGIAAAMLMTSVRAFLTAAVERYRDPADLLGEVNRHLTRDCTASGRFTTMFFLEIDPKEMLLRWVRAGHEPALLYHPGDDLPTRLLGPGLVLGINGEYAYSTSTHQGLRSGDIILVGTDGLHETRNEQGESFGQHRLQSLLKEHAGAKAAGIRAAITEAISAFRGEHPQEDDITLVVIKVR
jgi:sigma-B regulation protein RsbU (phosphoserine phosphatase)